jgi:hypothetical protein
VAVNVNKPNRVDWCSSAGRVSTATPSQRTQLPPPLYRTATRNGIVSGPGPCQRRARLSGRHASPKLIIAAERCRERLLA